jgi:DNA-binding transcriptional MerR regulator
MKKLVFILNLFLISINADAIIDTWKVLKNTEDMIDVLDTVQEVGETIEEDTPLVDDTKSDILTMRHDLKELGYTSNEIEEIMSPYEFGHQINTESIRKLNRHGRRIKNLHKRILLSSGLKGTPNGVTARESIQSNVTLQQIHSELVYDRMLREKKDLRDKKQDLKGRIEEEKILKAELASNDSDSKKLFGYPFSPFKIEKAKGAVVE